MIIEEEREWKRSRDSWHENGTKKLASRTVKKLELTPSRAGLIEKKTNEIGDSHSHLDFSYFMFKIFDLSR